jgi:hypothetical protein
MYKIKLEIDQPTLQVKTSCAIFITTFGASATGMRTKAQLMWPEKQFTDDDVNIEAANLLGEIHQSLLNQLPQQEIEKIEKRQVERLSFAL